MGGDGAKKHKAGLSPNRRVIPPPRPTDFDAVPTRRPPPPARADAHPAHRKSLPTLPAPPELAVLLVGSGYSMREALQRSLLGRGLHVEMASKQDLKEVVVAAAPDLLVLVGDAAADSGQEVARALQASTTSSVIPVVLVTEDPSLDTRVHAFRHGIAAVVKSSASADEIASRIAELAADIPERDGITRGNAGRATLADLVELLATEVKTGILSVTTGGQSGGGGVQLLLGEGRPIAEIIDEFVGKLKTQVVSAEPLEYEFDERAGGSLKILGADSAPPPPGMADVAGVRVVLADDDAARADAVAQELRRRGAVALVTDLAPEGARFERMRLLDPAILLIGERQLQAGGAELVRRMREDARLRWVSLLVVRWDEVWPTDAVDPSVEPLLGGMTALVEPERSIAERAATGAAFDTRLEIIGPARLLRILGKSEQSLRIGIHNPRISVTVDLGQGLIVGAEAHTFGESQRKLEGREALAALLVLSTGRVHIEATENPANANVMDPVEIALNQALSEEPPIPPSRPAVSALGAVDAALSIAPALHPVPVPLPPEADAAFWDSPTTVQRADTPIVHAESKEPAEARTKSRLVPALIVLGLATAALAAVLFMRRSPQTPPPSVSAPTASVEEAPGAPLPASLLERAARGEARAMAELEARAPEQRSTEESLAIARGRIALKRTELEQLQKSIERDPKLVDRPGTLETLRAHATDPTTSAEGLRAIAELPGPRGADLLYEIWTGTSERNPTTELSAQLVQSADVRKKASPALLAVLDLRAATGCSDVLALLPRVQKHADERAVRPLARLLRRSGCGKNGGTDCYPCLRRAQDVNETIAAVQQRRAPLGSKARGPGH